MNMSDGRKPHFSEWVWESTEQNVAIPPRDSSKVIPVPERPSIEIQEKLVEKERPVSDDDAVQLQLWDAESQEPVTTTESQFVQRAKELEWAEGESTLFVPFKSYWPTMAI
jgi:hypothetical protein